MAPTSLEPEKEPRRSPLVRLRRLWRLSSRAFLAASPRIPSGPVDEGQLLRAAKEREKREEVS